MVNGKDGMCVCWGWVGGGAVVQSIQHKQSKVELIVIVIVHPKDSKETPGRKENASVIMLLNI